jgi:hypothetical protein
MSLWRHLTRGLRGLFNEPAANQDVADEVAHYLDQATAELEAGGLSHEDARRAVHVELGSPSVVREQVRSNGWEHPIRSLAADFRYGARQMRHNRGFDQVTTLT